MRPATRRQAPAPKSAVVWAEVDRSATGPDGTRCAARVRRPVAGWIQPDARPATEPYLAAYLDSLPDCPAPVRRVTEASPMAALAERFLEEVPLPVPRPRIAPGRAITGLPAFLETRGATEHRFTRPTPFGTMSIVARGTYRVDWGDGTVTGPHSTEGRPWPEGTISHRYTNAGRYDVVVHEEWTATWTVGDQAGTLDDLRTTARIGSFPVGELQAVGVRPPAG